MDEKPEVPRSLEECFSALRNVLGEGQTASLAGGTEDEVVTYHHSLGRWLRNNWGLWHGSRLKEYFKTRGVYHPDDMSGIILVSFWRHLNNKPIRLDDQKKKYDEHWAAQGINPEEEFK